MVRYGLAIVTMVCLAGSALADSEPRAPTDGSLRQLLYICDHGLTREVRGNLSGQADPSNLRGGIEGAGSLIEKGAIVDSPRFDAELAANATACKETFAPTILGPSRSERDRAASSMASVVARIAETRGDLSISRDKLARFERKLNAVRKEQRSEVEHVKGLSVPWGANEAAQDVYRRMREDHQKAIDDLEDKIAEEKGKITKLERMIAGDEELLENLRQDVAETR